MSWLSKWRNRWFTRQPAAARRKTMTPKDKDAILDQMSVHVNAIAYCQTLAEENHEAEKAEQLDELKKEFQQLQDQLLHASYQNWICEAQAMQTKLHANQAELKLIIQNIEQQIQITENIIQAIGTVEKIVSVARGLLPAA